MCLLCAELIFAAVLQLALYAVQYHVSGFRLIMNDIALAVFLFQRSRIMRMPVFCSAGYVIALRQCAAYATNGAVMRRILRF